MIRRACIALLFMMLSLTAPASADAQFTASIVELTPTLPTNGATIRLQLQLENPGATDVDDLRAQFFVSTSPLVGRSQIDAISNGELLPTYRTLDSYVASGIDLSSGASTTVPLTTSTRALGLQSDRPGVYTFGVIITAADGSSVRAQTFLPWLPDTNAGKALGVVPVITLSAPPQRAVDGTFLNNSLPISISTGGRLRSQLDAMLLVRNATWLLDPVTLEAVQALSGGARITDGDGVRAASNDEMAAAAQWLTDLRVAAARGQAYAIPAGDLDVRAALKFGHRTLARDAIISAAPRVASVLGVTSVPLAVQIYGGTVTDSTWEFLKSCGVRVVFASDDGYVASQKLYTPSTSMSVAAFGEQAVLVIDQVSSDVLGRTRSEQLRRQQFAAHLLMTYLEQPNKQRTVTIALPQTWSPELDARTSWLFTAPWITQTTVDDADRTPGEPRQATVTKATVQQQQQDRALHQALRVQRLLQRLTTDLDFNTAVRDAVTGIGSRWFTAALAADAYTKTTNSKLRELADSVRVVTRGDIVFGGEQGVVPVTVANGLPVAIDVNLRASGLPSVRVAPQESTALHLNAGKRVSVEVPTRVTGSGTAYLQFWLETPQGSMIGDAVILDIRSAAYARVASYLVAAAFVTLLLLIGVNTIRRIRVRRAGTEHTE